MPFILQRSGGSTAMYVAPPGQEKSYVRDRGKAQVYPDKATALAQACGNEKAIEHGA